MTRASTAARIVAGFALAGWAGAGRPARAEVIYELAPMSSLGMTTNAQVTTVPVADALLTLANTARLRVVTPRSAHAFSYRLAWTRFIDGGISTLTNDLGASSAFNPTPDWSLSLSAIGSLASTARTDFLDPTTIVPQASQSGSQPFLSLGAAESASFQATPRWRFTQGAYASRLDYLSSTSLQPPSMALTGTLRTDLTLTRNSFWLDARFSDFFVDGVPPMAMGAFAGGHTYTAQLAAGWTHELSPSWWFDLSGGPLAIFRAGGPWVFQPAAAGQLRYRRQTWFATLGASQVPMFNLFTGTVTVNDQATLRLALPLTRNEATVLAGFAGYTYARAPDSNGDLVRAYDQVSVGAILTHHFGRLPLFGSVQYTLIDQMGGTGVTGSLPTVVRQTVMISLGGLLVWGPAPPPQYGGAAM